MRADETDFRVGLLRFNRLGHLAIVAQRRRAGVDDDVIVFLRDAQAFVLLDAVRRTVEQFAARHERGGLREPGRIPIAGDFALRLVARTSAAVITVKTWR